MMRALLLLTLVLPAFVSSRASQENPPAARPLQNIAEPPRAGKIQFVGFTFQQPRLYHMGVHYGPIEGPPSAGVQYGVEASIGGDEGIATATFHVTDEAGAAMQPIRMAAHSTVCTWSPEMRAAASKRSSTRQACSSDRSRVHRRAA